MLSEPQLPITGQPPLQLVKIELSNGLKISAPVDLWVATLIETIDEELRTAWFNKMVTKIQTMQQQPRLFIPGQG